MSRTTVGILRGGTSTEYPYSLKTGAAMMNALSPEEFDVRDILIDKNGLWHLRGVPTHPTRALAQVDVVLNALHGGVGEDGSVVRILDSLGMPYVGSSAHASASSFNKFRARSILRDASIRVPVGLGFTLTDTPTGDMAKSVFEVMGPPYIVKPAAASGSQGVRYVPTIYDLPDAIGDTLDAFGTALVEEYVLGEHAVVGIIDAFRGDDVYALPPARIIVPEGARHIQWEHLGGQLDYVVPSDFSYLEKQSLEDTARKAHRALGLTHVSSVDFILTKHGPILIEVDALPHLHEHSAFPQMLKVVGSSLSELLKHAITLARA